MGPCHIISTMFALLVVLSLLFNCHAGLYNHSEIHKANGLIDSLYTKLHTKLQAYQTKYERLQQESKEYLEQSDTTQDEIKMLKRLKGLLNDLTRKSSMCEKFYTHFDFTVAREIVINSNVSLQKDHTLAVEVNHRDLINNNLALANGNDLRVYFRKSEDCQPKEIDRILENIATEKTRVLFKLQENLGESINDGSAYYLVYGNKDAGKAKQNPENVYLFYDDFSDLNLERKWQKNWGIIDVVNGALKLITDATPTGDNAEISVFVKNGQEWEDIEVDLDFNEMNNNVAPGPFLRVQDTRIQTTSGWWIEYVTGGQDCTMRPLKKNVDGGWISIYTKKFLNGPMPAGSWNHAKYRIVGDRFSHWLNNDLMHNNELVSSQWMINKGTFGLGCHTGSTGCETFYDNIKITKYIPVLPSLSLGPECKVDLNKFRGHPLGTSKLNPAQSCKQIHDIMSSSGKLKNGVYWIKTSADRSVQTYCDLTNGGWTLVGKVSGFVEKLHSFWLIKNHNVDALNSPGLPSKVGSMDGRYLAAHHASTVMLSSGDSQNGIGSKWVKWPLPQGRESSSLWTHSLGLSTVSKAKMNRVTVTAWNGQQQGCYQNKYGIMPLPQHGGSYPSATYNTAGNTNTNDYCMAVGVQKTGTTVHGWTQNANGYDSPRSNSDWPNRQYNHVSPYVTVWLK